MVKSRLAVVMIVGFLCISSASHAQGKFGIGFVVGEPTGFAWKYKLNQVNALDGVVGFSPFDRFRLHVDYLWKSNPFNEARLALHYGPGVAFGFGRTQYIVYNSQNNAFLRTEEIGFAIRGNIGLNYEIRKTPLELFFEIAPLIIFAPGTGSGVDVGFGGRYYP